MRVGSKGRYAVTAVIFLAQQETRAPMPLTDIAQLHEISLSYLEQIFSKLRRAGLVRSVRGPGGGYMLSRSPDEILISDIIASVEVLTARERKSASKSVADGSETIALWESLGNQVLGFLSSISVADVCERRIEAVGRFIEQNPKARAAVS